MKTPPAAGVVLRVGIALLLCAACFQAGRWYQELSGSATAQAKDDPGTEMVTPTFVGPAAPVPAPVEVSQPAAAGGDPFGHGGDVITPLNVRDPSALVMGPGGYQRACPQPEDAAPEPPAKKVKPRKLKEGRLLELLEKADKKSGAPKRY